MSLVRFNDFMLLLKGRQALNIVDLKCLLGSVRVLLHQRWKYRDGNCRKSSKVRKWYKLRESSSLMCCNYKSSVRISGFGFSINLSQIQKK